LAIVDAIDDILFYQLEGSEAASRFSNQIGASVN